MKLQTSINTDDEMQEEKLPDNTADCPEAGESSQYARHKASKLRHLSRGLGKSPYLQPEAVLAEKDRLTTIRALIKTQRKYLGGK